MARSQAAAKEQEKSGPVLVINRTDDGFQVYAPVDPSQSHLVSGDANKPHCTCPAFEFMEDSPDLRCEHIAAVFGTKESETAKPATEPGRPKTKPPKSETEISSNGKGATMLLKRSVSPDGRIDSLSVEFSCPVGGATAKDIKAKATRTVELQTDIVASFLSANGKEKPQSSNGNGGHGNGNHGNGNHSHGAVPAQMLNIGGMNTKWGRRLYIAIQANGDTLKLFGNRKRLAEALVAAGYPDLAENIDEGIKINVPCLVTTKPSDNGKYTNIDEIFPAEKPTASRGKR